MSGSLLAGEVSCGYNTCQWAVPKAALSPGSRTVIESDCYQDSPGVEKNGATKTVLANGDKKFIRVACCHSLGKLFVCVEVVWNTEPVCVGLGMIASTPE